MRSSQLGKDETGQFLRDLNSFKNDWPPLLLLTELYTQALLTMGDDEFFSTAVPARNKATSSAARNPFSVGEVITLSRQLLNIVFPLYWNEAPKTSLGVPISWELVRERITACLKAIHARESVNIFVAYELTLTLSIVSSRRPFTPPRHWLIIDQSEVRSFVDAAM